MQWVCDGEADCIDSEDESIDQGCSIINGCSALSFRCQNGQCIDPSFVCDGVPDCTDESDEHDHCSDVVEANCAKDEYKCHNLKCISMTNVCDLKDDCGDNSDEHHENCKNSTFLCGGPNLWRCLNGVCISESQMCNGMDDCGDYSDEKSCGINECALLDNLCAHKCEDRKIGFECTCDTGYKVDSEDHRLCRDIDECLDRPCDHICINRDGSYKCECHKNFVLKNDHHSCKLLSEHPAKLVFSNRYYIRELDLSGRMNLLIHNLSNAVALDYDWESQCYFWSDVTSQVSSIKKYCIKENKTTALHNHTVQNPDGLAIDWVGKNLYWCDKVLDTIEVSNLDGKFRRVLLNKGLQEPRAIVLDPYKRYLYWTDWGDSPHIGKAGMDGSNETIIVNKGLGWPNALTISFETDELFWGDAREDYIAVSDLDGKNIKIILSREKNSLLNLHHIFALAVWENRIYWTDWEKKSVESCSKSQGDNCSTLATVIHRPMDIRVFHPNRQQKPVDYCKDSGCSTLCLLSPNEQGYICACPDNFILDDDKKNCNQNCTSAHFICKTTYKCIPFYWMCDSQDDCEDGSDEPTHCPKSTCEPGKL